MVMAVFTLPSFNAVFKIIKDSFGAPKNTTRQAVMDKYHFVFVRDRVGRLADAQEFEHLEFPRRCFPDDLLAYLLGVAGKTVRVEGDRVIIRQLYIERRVIPLNLFIRDADEAAACEAVIDYGNAIKDLAAADIFTGDMLLEKLRSHPARPGDLLRLRRAGASVGVPVPPPAAAVVDGGGIRGGAVVPRGRDGCVSRRSSAPSWCRPAGFATRSSRCTATCSTWSTGRACSACSLDGEVFDVFPYRRSARLKRDPDR